MKIMTRKIFLNGPFFKKPVWNLLEVIKGRKFTHLRNFISEIEELQVNRKYALKQKDSNFFAEKKFFNRCFHKVFPRVKCSYLFTKKTRWKVLLVIPNGFWQHYFDLNDSYMLVPMLMVHDELYFTEERFWKFY